VVKTIDEVLDSEDKEQLSKISKDPNEIILCGVMDNVRHIECDFENGDVSIRLFNSMRNLYGFVRFMKDFLCGNNALKEKAELLGLAPKEYKKREKMLKGLLLERNEDIDKHKFYLSERMGYDVGWLYSSAHWEKEIGPEFFSTRSNGFAWNGLEKAVVIYVPFSKEKYRLLTRYEDLEAEFKVAQHGIFWTGKTQENCKCLDITERCRIARELFDKMILYNETVLVIDIPKNIKELHPYPHQSPSSL
jgi:hypothetical protein